MAPTQTQAPGPPSTWAVVMPDQREAYRLAIEKFNVPVARQNRRSCDDCEAREP